MGKSFYHPPLIRANEIQSTDPTQYATYKSGITQLEFISLAARTYLLTRNETLLHITEKLFNWVVDSGMVDLATGTVYDGVDTVACKVSTAQWSYSYGVSYLTDLKIKTKKDS